jgi:cytochrome c peroxidase
MREHRLNVTRGVLAAIITLELLWAAEAYSESGPSNTNGEDIVEFSPSETARIFQHSPLPSLPQDLSNSVEGSEAAAHLGQFLFFERRLSANGAFSCATCHRPDFNWTDGKELSEGAGTGFRRTLSLWNVAYNRWYFWDGRADSLWSQALKPIEGRTEMNGSRVRVAFLIRTDPDLRLAYTRIFGELPELSHLEEVRRSARPVLQDPTNPDELAWNEIAKRDQEDINRIFSNVGKALAAYERQIISRDAPFDTFVEGLKGHDIAKLASISGSAKRGLKLFVGRGNCRLCHSGPLFSDEEFHNIRLPSLVSRALPPDAGRFNGIDSLMKDEFNSAGAYSSGNTRVFSARLQAIRKGDHNWGEFKTPGLRNVAERSPYMHEGQFATLPDVLHYYSTLDQAVPPDHDQEQILAPLDLSEGEIADLVEFLKSLTGRPLNEKLLRQPASPLLPEPDVKQRH